VVVVVVVEVEVVGVVVAASVVVVAGVVVLAALRLFMFYSLLFNSLLSNSLLFYFLSPTPSSPTPYPITATTNRLPDCHTTTTARGVAACLTATQERRRAVLGACLTAHLAPHLTHTAHLGRRAHTPPKTRRRARKTAVVNLGGVYI